MNTTSKMKKKIKQKNSFQHIYCQWFIKENSSLLKFVWAWLTSAPACLSLKITYFIQFWWHTTYVKEKEAPIFEKNIKLLQHTNHFSQQEAKKGKCNSLTNRGATKKNKLGLSCAKLSTAWAGCLLAVCWLATSYWPNQLMLRLPTTLNSHVKLCWAGK